MTRSRIHIGPGGLLYLVIATLIFGAAFYTQANLLFWSFGLMVGGLMISIALSMVVLRKVTVTRLVPSHGVAGEMLAIRYQLENSKRFIPVFNIVIREQWGNGRRGWTTKGPIASDPQQLTGQPIGWVLHLGPGQTAQAEAVCWPSVRGELMFERVELSTSFPFGVITKSVTIEQRDHVLIYPKLHRIKRRLLLQLESAQYSGKRLLNRGGGHDEFFGVRPYRSGDSLKRIDWKHSARTGELISREFTHQSHPRMMVMLDLQTGLQSDSEKNAPEHRQKIERAISLAASLICDAYFYGYQIGLVVRGAQAAVHSVHHSQPHRAQILETLSILDMKNTTDDPPVLAGMPSVVIHLGDNDRVGGGCVHLSADRIEQYVREANANEIATGGKRNSGYSQIRLNPPTQNKMPPAAQVMRAGLGETATVNKGAADEH